MAEDLRVTRTKEAIRRTFSDMLCEMDYERISVKELARRAQINRKTFYLHYDSLDDLLRELQDEMVKSFVERTKHLERPRDMDQVTREFYLSSEGEDPLPSRLMLSAPHHYIGQRITDEIMAETWEADRKKSKIDPYIHNIVTTFVSRGTIEIYKQWVADGRKVPLEDIIALTSQLICHGLAGLDK